MVRKSKPIENCTPNANVEKSGTDKEQSQSTLKTVSTNGRSAPSKDSYHKDSESREQRFSSGRRAKENRMEMRERRRDRRPGTTK